MSSEESAARAPRVDRRKTNQGRGMFVVVSSPSGGGKGTLIKRALQIVPDLGYSVSYTTRPPRRGEQNGRDYQFVATDEFSEMRARGEFLEWAVVHGNYYGTSRIAVERETARGRDIILEIDTQGAEAVRAGMNDVVSIFILPPSFNILRARLRGRNSETGDDLALRLANARHEVERYREFDYVIINDDAERAAQQLASIVRAERARRARQETVIKDALVSFREVLPDAS